VKIVNLKLDVSVLGNWVATWWDCGWPGTRQRWRCWNESWYVMWFGL